MKVEDYIRSIPDFPHEGIIFRDVSTLFGDPRGFRMAIDLLLHPFTGQPIDHVAGIEARGFILGGAIAHQLSVGFLPVRKKGKLPRKTVEQDYKLEYGEATVEVHEDAAKPGDKVLIVDDLLATGGTGLQKLQSSWFDASEQTLSAVHLLSICPISEGENASKHSIRQFTHCAASKAHNAAFLHNISEY